MVRLVAGLVIALVAGCRKSQRPAAPPPEAPSTPATAPEASRDDGATALRAALVDEVATSVHDPRVLGALRRVERHRFVPGASLEDAYGDHPLSIGHDQTISQPTIVGIMTEALALTGTERVLEIGTGSGYQAAVLSLLAADVYTIEIVEPLGRRAGERLQELGYANVHVRIGDGYQGWPEQAPFDRVMVTAAPPEVPAALLAQLREGGILVVPVGQPEDGQRLIRMTKTKRGVRQEDLGGVRFVPMVHAR